MPQKIMLCIQFKLKMSIKNFFFSVMFLCLAKGLFGQCACCAGAGTGSSSGDWNNGLLTLPQKQLAVEMNGDYRTLDEPIADSHGHHHGNDTLGQPEAILRSMGIASLGVRYGISDKITVSALAPYVFLHTKTGNDHGLGDLILLGTFNVFSRNNLAFALQGGIEIPIGVQKSSNFDNSTVVVGSGSWDPMAGLMFSKQWGRAGIKGNGLFKKTTRGFEGNHYGDLSVQNIAFSYRLLGKEDACEPDTTLGKNKAELGLHLVAGYYGEWLGKVIENEIVDDNSGYYLGFATLGTTFTLGKWSFPLTYSLPVVNQMNGNQTDAGFRARMGVVRRF